MMHENLNPKEKMRARSDGNSHVTESVDHKRHRTLEQVMLNQTTAEMLLFRNACTKCETVSFGVDGVRLWRDQS